MYRDPLQAHVAFDLPRLAEAGGWEGEAACHPLPQVL